MNAAPPNVRGAVPGSSQAPRVHKRGVVQGKRCFQHDYRAPWFYMITITTLGRRVEAHAIEGFGVDTNRNRCACLPPANR